MTFEAEMRHRQVVMGWLAEIENRVGTRRGWGTPHSLWVISTRDSGVNADGDEMADAIFIDLPLPESFDTAVVGTLLSMGAAINRIATLGPKILDLATEGELFGLALVAEQWTIPEPDTDSEEWLHRDWAEHPMRELVRAVFGVDVHGGIYTLMRVKETDQVLRMYNLPGRAGACTCGLDCSNPNQRVTDALTLLLAALAEKAAQGV
jgi:hypothetical protein